MRYRTVLIPAAHGGEMCGGEETETRICESQTCPGKHIIIIVTTNTLSIIYYIIILKPRELFQSEILR